MSAQLYCHIHNHGSHLPSKVAEAGNAALQSTSLSLQVPDRSAMLSQMFFYDTEVGFCAYTEVGFCTYKSFSNDFERQRFLEQ